MQEPAKRLLIDAFQKGTYPKGAYIHFDGDICDHINLIIHGVIEVEHLNEDGSKLMVNQFQSGQIIGLNIIFSSHPYYIMNFLAQSDVVMASIKKDVFEDHLFQSKTLMKNVLSILSDNSLRIGQKLKRDFKLTIKEKLLTYLDAQHIKQHCNPIVLPMSKTKLAELFGVSRTSVSRTLKQMEEEGLLKVNRSLITLCNKKRH